MIQNSKVMKIKRQKRGSRASNIMVSLSFFALFARTALSCAIALTGVGATAILPMALFRWPKFNIIRFTVAWTLQWNWGAIRELIKAHANCLHQSQIIPEQLSAPELFRQTISSEWMHFMEVHSRKCIVCPASYAPLTGSVSAQQWT